MRVLDLTDLHRRPVTDFGSVGFAASPVGADGVPVSLVVGQAAGGMRALVVEGDLEVP